MNTNTPTPTPTPAKRTPGPWHTELLPDGHWSIRGNTNPSYYVALTGLNRLEAQSGANAAYICEACNNYERVLAEREELADACAEALAACREWGYGKTGVAQQLKAVLSRIRVGK